jgi:(+)-pinoresinol hydroxylase
MRHLSIVLSVLLAMPGVALAADDSAQAGKQVFARRCAECHAAGHGTPGTQQLGWIRGEKLAVLEQRTDLNREYLAHVVRHGLLEMPPLRPTEINDAELAQLLDYLVPAKAPAKKRR